MKSQRMNPPYAGASRAVKRTRQPILPKLCHLALAGTFMGLPLAGLAADAVAPAKAAQPSDADVLLNLFQKKGLISEQDVKEAHDALASRNKDVVTTGSKVSAMPDWVTGVKFYGDFRGRFEENAAENIGYSVRDRYRYRLRLGATMSLLDDFEVGVRLASGNPTTAGGNLVGGQPITANQDMNSLESRKFIWIDAAYAKWTAIKTEDWTLSGTIGKMDNPFSLSNMIWDYDIDPEGAALQLAYKFDNRHTLKVNGAFFVLDEINQYDPVNKPTILPSRDPFVYGAQALLESKWMPKFESSLGVAVFDVAHRDSLSAKVQPFYNSGNSRDFTSGGLLYNYNPIIGTASATYKLDSFPLYPGKYPISAMVEYMENPGAPDNNTAYRLGTRLGKAGKKGQWELNYRYQRLEADAWFDALVDDDNGAYYALGNTQLNGTGKLNGWFGGTNVRGHLVQGVYSFTDFLNLTFTYYLNDLIIGVPGQSSDARHLMVDLNWRF